MSDDHAPDPSFNDLKQILTLLAQPDIQFAILDNVLTQEDNSEISEVMKIELQRHLSKTFGEMRSSNGHTEKVTITVLGRTEEISMPALQEADIFRICGGSSVRVNAILKAMPSHLAPDQEALRRVKNYFFQASKGPRIIEVTANKVQNLPEDLRPYGQP